MQSYYVEGGTHLRGYFVCKPSSLDEVRAAEAKHRRGIRPTEIIPFAEVRLSLDEYLRFCDEMAQHWDFLKPFADESYFTGDGAARCVYVCASGQHRIAVCLEGYDYPRYVAWPFL